MDYSAHTYTKPDPNCSKCGGRGIEVIVSQVPSSPDLSQIANVRCECTDIPAVDESDMSEGEFRTMVNKTLAIQPEPAP